MEYGGSNLILILLALLTVTEGALPQDTEHPITAFVDRTSTSVIAFLPPSMQDSADNAAAAAQERVRAAIRDTKLCLGEDDISYRVVFADRIVVSSPGREDSSGWGRRRRPFQRG